ncbi:hypothetical protein K492DRAFT_182032 [Lichtheimia hyalospora FSU 10163]|nr:hypothetical protein K492DRAFT_182032 [Lichtheimia hyalospora FSU 10163]
MAQTAHISNTKNLRVNGTILDSLQRLNPSNPVKQIVAMDWLGYVGHMIDLVDVHGVYYAEKIGVLLLPKSTMDLHSFINTLDILFCYKRFIISLGQRTVAAYNKRQTTDILREVIDVADTSPLTQDHHDIFSLHHSSEKKDQVHRALIYAPYIA